MLYAVGVASIILEAMINTYIEDRTPTVSVPLEPRGSIFNYGFLGGVLFKFEQPGGVFKVGLY